VCRELAAGERAKMLSSEPAHVPLRVASTPAAGAAAGRQARGAADLFRPPPGHLGQRCSLVVPATGDSTHNRRSVQGGVPAL
jgi:hypothetical protein